MLQEHFQSAVDTNFETLGVTAIYNDGTTSSECLVLYRMPDDEYDASGSKVVGVNSIIDVRKSEVASPRKGHTFSVSGQTYTIHSTPMLRDPLRMIWECHCRAS